jgi:protein TonB
MRHVVALVSMLLGSAAVLGANVLMNEYTRPEKKEAVEKTTVIDVAAKKKKPRENRQAERRKQRAAPQTARHAPTPNIQSAISSVDIAMPGFDSAQLGAVSETVLGVSGKNQVMDEASVDTPPKPVERVAPDEYPRKARERGITGFVTMNLLINTAGEIERVKVLQAEPNGVFDEVALATIRKWRFEPAVYESAPVRFELN